MVKFLLKHIFRRGKSVTEQLLDARRQALHGSGVRVAISERTALSIAAYWASIRAIAETIASLPVRIYEAREDGGRNEVSDHPAGWVLRHEPNPYQTPMIWAENSLANILTWGNSVDQIEFDDAGDPVRLWNLHPSCVSLETTRKGALFYRIRAAGGGELELDRSQVLHVPWIGDGYWGLSPVQVHARTLGLAVAKDQFAATFYAQGARPSLHVNSVRNLTDTQFRAIREDLQEHYSGSDAWRPLVTTGEVQVTTLTMPLNDAEFLESKKYQAEEIGSRIFRIPPHVLGFLDRATFGNVEAMDLFYVKHCLRPWVVRREQEYNRKLFRRSERGRLYVKFNLDALTRGSLAERYSAHAVAVTNGLKTVNEVRGDEDLNPIDGGDEAYFPLNMGRLGENQPGDEGRAQQRLISVTRSLLAGLYERELKTVAALADKPDAAQRLEGWYDGHAGVIRDRLAPLQAPNEALDDVVAAMRERQRVALSVTETQTPFFDAVAAARRDLQALFGTSHD